MKLTKQILEAINRGINLALDNYEDDELNGSLFPNKDVIGSEDIIKYKVDLMKEVVDLGLPSGTLWCKYNLGVNSNQLIKPEDWYGNYYAWGEIEQHKGLSSNKNLEPYDWQNYKYAVDDSHTLTKYCTFPMYGLNGFTDNLTELLPEDDAAYQNKHIGNYKFHIPTKEQFDELIDYTKNHWTNNYNGISGLNGWIFKGKNGNEIFFPYAGQYDGSKQNEIGTKGYYWSSSLDSAPFFASCLYISTMTFTHYEYRCNGFSVRPVINL